MNTECDTKKHGCAPLLESRGNIMQVGRSWKKGFLTDGMDVDLTRNRFGEKLRSSFLSDIFRIVAGNDVLDSVSLYKRRT
jgi:hypothetical protein